MPVKFLKRGLLLMAVAVFLFGAVSCGDKDESAKKAEEQKTEGTADTEREITIGISKIVSHPALDGVEKGIQDQLKEMGYENVTYDFQNAQGDPSTAKQIAVKFKADKVDLAVGIATPTSQALASTLDQIPIIFSAVTDPVGAGLVPSLKEGGKNITGFSDMTPVAEQLKLLTKITEVKKLGHVYSSSEANAVTLAGLAKEVCGEMGIEFVEATVTNSAEVKQATQSIVGRVDAIYVSTDNTVVSAFNSLTEVTMENGIPVMSADPSSAKSYNVMAALGFDYYKHGRATGRLIARILEGENPKTVPTQFMNDPSDVDQLLINLDVANELGITIPKEVKDRANMIIENGELTEL